MKRWFPGIAAIILAATMMAPLWRLTTVRAQTAPAAAVQVRIGVYDPRAVAIAYAQSRFCTEKLAPKLDELAKAKAAKDEAKVKELETWGKDQQTRLHLQGFAGAPVDDLMAQVKEQIPAVAAAANVQSIGLRPDYTAPGVEIVDVTDDLVKLWSPDAKTLKMIAGVRTTAPIAIEQIAKMGPND